MIPIRMNDSLRARSTIKLFNFPIEAGHGWKAGRRLFQLNEPAKELSF